MRLPRIDKDHVALVVNTNIRWTSIGLSSKIFSISIIS